MRARQGGHERLGAVIGALVVASARTACGDSRHEPGAEDGTRPASSETNEAGFIVRFEQVESAHVRAGVSESGDSERSLEEDVLPHLQP